MHSRPSFLLGPRRFHIDSWTLRDTNQSSFSDGERYPYWSSSLRDVPKALPRLPEFISVDGYLIENIGKWFLKKCSNCDAFSQRLQQLERRAFIKLEEEMPEDQRHRGVTVTLVRALFQQMRNLRHFIFFQMKMKEKKRSGIFFLIVLGLPMLRMIFN